MTTSAHWFVGIGSWQGDDALGWRVAEELQALDLQNVEIRRATVPAQLLDWLDDASTIQRLILCDAFAADSHPGRIHHARWPNLELIHRRPRGDHDLSLEVVLQLAERLGKLPPDVRIWGIECRAENFQSLTHFENSPHPRNTTSRSATATPTIYRPTIRLSREVESSLPELLRGIQEELTDA